MQNKEQVKQYLLKLIAADDKAMVAKAVEYFGKSKSTIYNYIAEMLSDGIITKSDSGYSLVAKEYVFSYKNNGKLSESRICSLDIEPLIKGYPKNVVSIWRYAYMAMMNNAIEHSESTDISVTVRIDNVKTTVFIEDNGLGIFKNIKRYVYNKFEDDIPLEECASLLFAGKFTTAESMHSGEGIFFTSHMMDEFMILSDDIVFTRDNFHDERFHSLKESAGTLVIMSLSNSSKKTTIEVFDRFSNVDDGFIKTSIPISHVFPNGDPISRSEARRLGELISKFKEVDLDFAGTEEVGQAFVHELFIVWQRNNPDVTLNVLNADKNVDFMIRRVINTK